MLTSGKYNAIHSWLRTTFGSANQCTECKNPDLKYEWALIHGKTHERKRENYTQLCQSCHRTYDKRHGNTGHKRKNVVMISADAHKRLKASALKHKRTLSAQVDYLLELAKKHEVSR